MRSLLTKDTVHVIKDTIFARAWIHCIWAVTCTNSTLPVHIMKGSFGLLAALAAVVAAVFLAGDADLPLLFKSVPSDRYKDKVMPCTSAQQSRRHNDA